MNLTFGGIDYCHRWSKHDQHEFTPNGQENLSSWRDMLTIQVYTVVKNGEHLASIANRVLASYQDGGHIVKTDSKKQTLWRPAEHLVVAVLGTSAFFEAVFARFVLEEGVGLALIYSHRIYGVHVGDAMSAWLVANGSAMESTVITWEGVPAASTLNALPRSE